VPTFSISVINESFECQDEQHLPTLELARAEAIKGALQIGVSEVRAANSFFAAEVKIHRDGEQVERYVVSVGVSPLR
jgi:hypothetical protein